MWGRNVCNDASAVKPTVMKQASGSFLDFLFLEAFPRIS